MHTEYEMCLVYRIISKPVMVFQKREIKKRKLSKIIVIIIKRKTILSNRK